MLEKKRKEETLKKKEIDFKRKRLVEERGKQLLRLLNKLPLIVWRQGKYSKHRNIFFIFTTLKKTPKKLCQESDMLNGLIQIDSTKPRGTLKPNYSIPKTVTKRVISVGPICINYSFIIPTDHSNYIVLLIYFSLFKITHPWNREAANMDLMGIFKNGSLIIL